MSGLAIVTSEDSPAWVVELLRLADAIHVLGPLRAGFTGDGGCHLDGRAGVPPRAVIEAAAQRRRQQAAQAVRPSTAPAGGRAQGEAMPEDRP